MPDRPHVDVGRARQRAGPDLPSLVVHCGDVAAQGAQSGRHQLRVPRTQRCVHSGRTDRQRRRAPGPAQSSTSIRAGGPSPCHRLVGGRGCPGHPCRRRLRVHANSLPVTAKVRHRGGRSAPCVGVTRRHDPPMIWPAVRRLRRDRRCSWRPTTTSRPPIPRRSCASSESRGDRVISVARWGLLPVVGGQPSGGRPDDQCAGRDGRHGQGLRGAPFRKGVVWYRRTAGSSGHDRRAQAPALHDVAGRVRLRRPVDRRTGSACPARSSRRRPSATCTRVHDRMPLLLEPDRWTEWLTAPADEALLAPPPLQVRGIDRDQAGRPGGRQRPKRWT